MTEITVPLYKVLVGGKSCHGGALDWSLPTPNDDGSWTPGEWMALPDPTRPLVLCEYALHLTDQPAAWYLPDAQCWLAEFRGESVGELTGAWESKLGVREARLVRLVDWADANVWTTGDHAIRAGVVWASDSATVRAYDSATVWASDSATVRAYGSATVEASGSATVISTSWHSNSAQVTLQHMAAHVDRRGGKVVCRVAGEASRAE